MAVSYQRRTCQRFNWPRGLSSVLPESQFDSKVNCWGWGSPAECVVSVAELEACDKRKWADVTSTDVRTVHEVKVSHLVTSYQSTARASL